MNHFDVLQGYIYDGGSSLAKLAYVIFVILLAGLEYALRQRSRCAHLNIL